MTGSWGYVGERVLEKIYPSIDSSRASVIFPASAFPRRPPGEPRGRLVFKVYALRRRQSLQEEDLLDPFLPSRRQHVASIPPSFPTPNEFYFPGGAGEEFHLSR